MENFTDISTDLTGEGTDVSTVNVSTVTTWTPDMLASDREDSVGSSIFAGVTALLIILSNGLVILSVYLNPLLRNWTYYFIVNLALSDLSTSLCCLCGVLVTGARHLLSTGVQCAVVYATYIFTTSSSAFALVLISTDRYLLICWPLKHGDVVQPFRAMAAIVAGWSLALAITAVPLLLPQAHTMTGTCLVEKVWPLAYVMSVCFAVYILPLVVIFVMYVHIAKVALRHRREISALQPQALSSVATVEGTLEDTPSGAQPSRPPTEARQSVSGNERADTGGGWKMTKMVLILSGYYTLSWLPFFVNLVMLTTHGRTLSALDTSGWFFPILNSLVNPFIYAFRIPIFRKTFLLIFRCRCRSLYM